MLRFGEDIKGLSVMVLDSGRRVASTVDIVLNPNDLSVAAFVCLPRSGNDESYLLPRDIHTFSPTTIVVQNDEALSSIDDLINLQKIIRINFTLAGKKVVTNTGTKVGAVREFVFDDQSFKVVRLHVKPPLTKFMQAKDLIISRGIIVEVNDKQIIVKDTLVKNSAFYGAVADA